MKEIKDNIIIIITTTTTTNFKSQGIFHWMIKIKIKNNINKNKTKEIILILKTKMKEELKNKSLVSFANKWAIMLIIVLKKVVEEWKIKETIINKKITTTTITIIIIIITIKIKLIIRVLNVEKKDI